jgi:hypothetical protein
MSREVMQMALETLESSRVFVMSRERIKQPEGADWYDNRITAIKEALAQPDPVLAEREACAKVVENTSWSNWFQSDCASAIRERSQS